MRYLTTIPIKLKTHDGEIKLKPGDTFTPKNEDAIKRLLAEGKVRPLRNVLAEKYQSLTDWLHQFDIGRDELKETLPELYMDIQDAIETLDSAFAIEDMTAFQDAFNKVRLLYTETLFKCGRRIAVKVYSEILQTHLWVVADDKDMKALKDSQNVSEAIYTADEIRKLKGLCKDSLKILHETKKAFPESTIKQITKKED